MMKRFATLGLVVTVSVAMVAAKANKVAKKGGHAREGVVVSVDTKAEGDKLGSLTVEYSPSSDAVAAGKKAKAHKTVLEVSKDTTFSGERADGTKVSKLEDLKAGDHVQVIAKRLSAKGEKPTRFGLTSITAVKTGSST